LNNEGYMNNNINTASVETTYQALIDTHLFDSDHTNFAQVLLQLTVVKEGGESKLALSTESRAFLDFGLIEKIKILFGCSSVNLKSISNFLNSEAGKALLNNVMVYAQNNKKSIVVSRKIEELNLRIQKQRKNHWFFKANEVTFFKGITLKNPFYVAKYLLSYLKLYAHHVEGLFSLGDENKKKEIINAYNSGKELTDDFKFNEHPSYIIAEATGNPKPLYAALILIEAIKDLNFFNASSKDLFLQAGKTSNQKKFP